MNRRQFVNTGLSVAFSALGGASCLQSHEENAPLPAINVGQIGLSFHIAAAAVVARILRHHGHPVTLSTALHEEMFATMRTGGVDVMSSAWLPGSHGKYLAPFEGEVEKLGVLYEPYALWGVPEFVPESAVREVSDLLKPEVAKRMTKVIQGIGPGAGISRFSREIMQSYDLGAAGYVFQNGTQKQCEEIFVRAVEEKRWVVVPLWHPQHLHHRYRIRELVEPKGLLRGKDSATLIARKDSLAKLDKAAVSVLRQLHLGNRAVTHLDYMINVEGRSAEEAVDVWFKENPSVVASWGLRS